MAWSHRRISQEGGFETGMDPQVRRMIFRQVHA